MFLRYKILCSALLALPAAAQVEIVSTMPASRQAASATQSAPLLTFKQLAHSVSQRTSVSLSPRLRIVNDYTKHAWLWVETIHAPHKLSQWLKKGGMLIVSGSPPAFTAKTFPATLGKWQHVPLDSALMRSFYLLNSLPTCNNKNWQVFMFHQRMAIVAIPYPLLAYLSDQPRKHPCLSAKDKETHIRVFINLLMVALATDYKKDQVHLPEILKRLR